ncbi:MULTISPECIES: heterodisulfide reductase-related iron-sulfur binding cluster [unclassified Methanoculleus]|uniref:heterodisulfide reductase-related iron-sulfur binding cluster n=1 Tax=unclassified Methanoculleus TaxID=2619537 RepID=UPI0025D8D100|nr:MULTISPECIES: heterodisulfide reductase-related iron-sulfur binding cluster [unclassified Methanoculleus]MCK9317252.1 heterodisulfide reductase-related iron-sulfur binding cluster [Methanoculleus sp.]MDD2253167.1 heterodisulfide reductase-related iron-sulfur binding cluster [Methanoculleus sp.]MDD2787097.1 heterodisulfide reductase-related iron-sulfur binding cluster [Methanoculleus sp.]MDD3215812.1 heterodisulfide reductase-related iron-sulfur binding cluster [Methanoculleus sp.]MDD4313752
MLSKALPADERIRDAITAGAIRHLLREEDPRLRNFQLCNACGSCTPYCTAQINDPGTERDWGYLARKVTAALQAGRCPDIDLSDCVQCYSCETACPRSVSIGGIINAVYEAEHAQPLFRKMLLDRGCLPPPAFLPLYTGRGRFRKFVAKAALRPSPVDARAVDEVRKMLLHPVRASTFSHPGGHVPERPSAPPDRVVHLTSCCAFNYPGSDLSQRAILTSLGIRYETSGMQTCCGGAPHYMGSAGFADRLLLTARNLSVFQDTPGAGDEIAITGICPTCSDSYASTLKLLSGNGNRAAVNEVLGRIGRHVGDPGVFRVANILDLYPLYLDELRRLVETRLSRLRVGVHVSCHYRKMNGSLAVPPGLRDLAAVTGAKVVRSEMEHYCCGGVKNLFDRHLTFPVEGLSRLNQMVYQDFVQQHLDVMVVDCPGCELVYDHMGVPVLHITELLALSLGADPRETVRIQGHLTSLKPALGRIGLL